MSATGFDENDVLYSIQKAYPLNTSITIYYDETQCSDAPNIKPPTACVFGIFFIMVALFGLVCTALYISYLLYNKNKYVPVRYTDLELVPPPRYEPAAEK